MQHKVDGALMSMPTPQPVRGRRKVRIGQVVSRKMAKTLVVRVTRRVRHPVYDRVIETASTFKVHDDANRAVPGDWVSIMETRPISKEKRWRLVKILKRASQAPPVPDVELEALREPAPEQGAGVPQTPGSTEAEPSP